MLFSGSTLISTRLRIVFYHFAYDIIAFIRVDEFHVEKMLWVFVQ